MTEPARDEVQRTLAQPQLHAAWVQTYDCEDNARFYERVFDRVAALLAAPPGAVLLDAGCGNAQHALRLARRGFKVCAVDFSPAALALAETAIQQSGLAHSIEMRREDLTRLSWPDDSFGYALCWGVLMHVPALEPALAELTRVIGPRGWLVISEGNRASLQSRLLGVARRLRRAKTREVDTPAGTEFWSEREGNALLTREADIPWLIGQLQQRGWTLQRRWPGQFTEAYARISSPAGRALVHAFNAAWFRWIGLPQMSFGNVLVFQKAK